MKPCLAIWTGRSQTTLKAMIDKQRQRMQRSVNVEYTLTKSDNC